MWLETMTGWRNVPRNDRIECDAGGGGWGVDYNRRGSHITGHEAVGNGVSTSCKAPIRRWRSSSDHDNHTCTVYPPVSILESADGTASQTR